MNNILFEGYYGHLNTGDDAFVEVAAWGAKEYWNVKNMTFIAETIPSIKTKVNHTGKQAFTGHNRLKIMRAIFQSKALIFAGGSTFHSALQPMEAKKLALIKKRHIRNFKLGAIGVSLGPYKSKKAELENVEFLKQFDFLTLRDTFSYNLALSYNLPFKPIEAFDLAALLPTIYKTNTNTSNKMPKIPILGISVCNYESYINNGNINNEKRRNRQIIELLKEVSRLDRNVKFRFFVFNGNHVNGDQSLTLFMANDLINSETNNVEIIPYNFNVFETWNKISECSVILATRLHAAVFACFSNVPFYLIEYHRKCSDFLESIGYQSDLRLFDADFEINDKAMDIIKIISGEINFIKPQYYKNAINKSLLNFTETKKYFI